MEDPPMINEAGRPASLRRAPQHCASIGPHRGPGVGHAAACRWASHAGATGPGFMAGRLAIIPRSGQPPSPPVRRIPW